jgi:hypothetical protein
MAEDVRGCQATRVIVSASSVTSCWCRGDIGRRSSCCRVEAVVEGRARGLAALCATVSASLGARWSDSLRRQHRSMVLADAISAAWWAGRLAPVPARACRRLARRDAIGQAGPTSRGRAPAGIHGGGAERRTRVRSADPWRSTSMVLRTLRMPAYAGHILQSHAFCARC